MHNKSLVGVAFATAFLGIGRTKIFEFLKEGEIRQVKIGRRTLIPFEDLLAYRDRLVGEVGEVSQ